MGYLDMLVELKGINILTRWVVLKLIAVRIKVEEILTVKLTLRIVFNWNNLVSIMVQRSVQIA